MLHKKEKGRRVFIVTKLIIESNSPLTICVQEKYINVNMCACVYVGIRGSGGNTSN